MFKYIKKKLSDRKTRDEELERTWIQELAESGFDQVVFPIIINHGDSLEFIESLDDYATDPDIYYFPYEDECELIDSKCFLWKCKYDDRVKANLPHKRIREMPEKQIINLILKMYKDNKTLKSHYA